jgi:thymidylate synthase (FAD)
LEVKLISHTPEPELAMAAAARLCYADVSAAEIRDRLSPDQVAKLLQRVVSSGHHSVLEHAGFSFAVDGLSRAASHQLVRHRLASYSQQSQRWVSFARASYVTPPMVAADPALKEQFEEAMAAAFAVYRQLREAGVPAEDARYVLPNAWTTRLVVTMNARELLHVCGLRLCPRSQWEIRRLFTLAKQEVAHVAPLFARHLQPKCVAVGFCDEEESCGIRPKR